MNNDTADAIMQEGAELHADRLHELRREMELRFGGEFVENAVNRLDAASNFLRLSARITSLAAQDSWTAKRVAELVEQGDGFWQSCSGCHETNDGAETGHYPFNPVFKTYQGAGCHECGGIGVVWDDTDYRHMAEFCLNADDPAPSLAAQDGLVEAAGELAFAEAEYRRKHDLCGRGHIDTGRAWDRMRRAGDKVRAALASIEVKS